MEPMRTPRKLLDRKSGGERKRGRLQPRMLDDVESDLKKMSII